MLDIFFSYGWEPDNDGDFMINNILNIEINEKNN
jgi:hypothetical protein